MRQMGYLVSWIIYYLMTLYLIHWRQMCKKRSAIYCMSWPMGINGDILWSIFQIIIVTRMNITNLVKLCYNVRNFLTCYSCSYDSSILWHLREHRHMRQMGYLVSWIIYYLMTLYLIHWRQMCKKRSAIYCMSWPMGINGDILWSIFQIIIVTRMNITNFVKLCYNVRNIFFMDFLIDNIRLR